MKKRIPFASGAVNFHSREYKVVNIIRISRKKDEIIMELCDVEGNLKKLPKWVSANVIWAPAFSSISTKHTPF